MPYLLMRVVQSAIHIVDTSHWAITLVCSNKSQLG